MGAVSLEVVPMNKSDHSLRGVPLVTLHRLYLLLLPRLETHARVFFRRVRCPAQQEDKVQECVALGWKWFLRLAEQGKDVFQFPKAFVALVARAVKCGRCLVGQERSKDVLSPLAQRRRGFRRRAAPLHDPQPARPPVRRPAHPDRV
jgi:hypothetical protein